MSRLDTLYAKYLDGRRESGNLRTLRPVTLSTGVHVHAGSRALINFCSNNYLGLSHHPLVIARAKEWTERWGAGSGASRLVSGNLELHESIEQKIAGLKASESALLFSSGFQANSSLLPALLDRHTLGAEPLVFVDRLIHASIHHGCAAAGARQIRYRHNDMDQLETRLRETKDRTGPRFIITESVFSMDGDRADLPALVDLAERYGAFLMLDEAHATGVLGPQGMGLSASAPGGVDLVIGTFSKGLGSFGAYVSCSRQLRDYLINRCPGFIYTTALPPSVLGAIDAALDLVPNMDAERARLHEHADRLRRALRAAGVDTLGSTTQIIPAVIGNELDTLSIAAQLEASGLLSIAIRPPTVPKGTSRLRFCVSAAHSREDIDQLLQVIPEIARRVSLPPASAERTP